MWQKIKNFYHFLVAVLANIVFFFPGRSIKVIGVTGTDGKTTTVNIISHILHQAGFKVGYLTTIGATINEKVYDTGFHVTTPSSFMLQRLLRRAVSAKTDYFVLEVTSHAIDQNRVFGIPFVAGVLTNVTNEHLDYHKTFDNYLKTKEKLLKWAKLAVVNKDDTSYTMLSDSKNKKTLDKWITYGLTESSDVNDSNFKFKTKLMGDFNKYNILAGVATCKALGVKEEIIKRAIETFELPLGRFDVVYDKDITVIIDFAHTPNAFEQVLSTARGLFKNRIIHVFGSAGERDPIKRPFMGEISSKYADIVIITAEDPRKEQVDKIIGEIEVGIKTKTGSVIRIPDRREAIEAAIQMAKKGDLVLITGKAHEKSINYGQGEQKWSEYEAVKLALNSRI